MCRISLLIASSHRELLLSLRHFCATLFFYDKVIHILFNELIIPKL